jgi:RNA polymerase sigma-70 factor, ECF subfamily
MGADKGDEMLVKQIKAGNKIAFEAMVIKYQPKLLSSLISYTKSFDQAEEICQKTFIRVWQKIDSFRSESALFTWIYRIAINLAKNEFASSHFKSSKKTVSLDLSEHEISSHISPETNLIDKESESLIFNFIESLDIELKTAFTLRELEGRSYEEISIIMRCPIGTVRSRIFRARSLILEFMTQENIIND